MWVEYCIYDGDSIREPEPLLPYRCNPWISQDTCIPAEQEKSTKRESERERERESQCIRKRSRIYLLMADTQTVGRLPIIDSIRNDSEVRASRCYCHGRKRCVPCRCDRIKHLNGCTASPNNNKLVLKSHRGTIVSILSQPR
jgi:hypothetical protein